VLLLPINHDGRPMTPVVVIPTYNERDNTDILLDDLLALPVNLSVIVVDDNSPDGTGDAAQTWAFCYPDRVHVIHRASKLGLGTAYIAGFKCAIESGFDRIITMDVDFSHHPRYISTMLTVSRERDLVIGSRYVVGGASNCAPHRKALSRGANTFAKAVLGLRPKDCTAGFRCYRREVLQAIELDSIRSNGYSFLIEMIFYAQRRGFSIGEVPIIFEDRRRGTSKISQNEVLRALQTVERLGARRLQEMFVR
jgi:dolichol-phosphate mannosyltransferase